MNDSTRSSYLLLFTASINAANHICGELAVVTFTGLHLSFPADDHDFFSQAGMHAVRKNRYVILPKDFEKVCNPLTVYEIVLDEYLVTSMVFSGSGIRQRSWH